jgi:hypothetical protein
MSLRLLAAGLVAALPFAFGPSAGAADLGDDPPPPPRHADNGCVPRHIVRERLIDDGWRDFQDPEVRGETALFTARRQGGARYLLRVDRCSGEIMHARRLTPRYETYAVEDYYDGPRYRYYYGPRVGFYGHGGRHWRHRRF